MNNRDDLTEEFVNGTRTSRGNAVIFREGTLQFIV